MENRSANGATHEEACARVAARFRSRWLRHYAASKLRNDPVFPMAYELLRESREPLLDVGCGVGLFPFYVRERGFTAALTGVDIDGPKIRQGRAAAREGDREIELREEDVSVEPSAPFRGNVAVFDLLHYLAPDAQQALLRRLGACVPSGGIVLIRDCPRDGSARFWMTYGGEIFAQAVRWNVGGTLNFPSPASIDSIFCGDAWIAEQYPAWGRTPFNNRLYVFRRATVPAAV